MYVDSVAVRERQRGEIAGWGGGRAICACTINQLWVKEW